MKKIISLFLITSFLSPAIIMPAQQSALEKVKQFLTSKPLVFFYGISLGVSGALFIRENANYFLVRRGALIDKEISNAKGIENYMKACTKSNYINQGISSGGKMFWCEAPANTYAEMKILESLKYDLEAYNAYLHAQGKPKINFDYVGLYADAPKSAVGVPR